METFFDTREQASAAAAERIQAALSRRLELQQTASLIVSGGTTPSRCFELLAETPLDWERVHVLLSDELAMNGCPTIVERSFCSMAPSVRLAIRMTPPSLRVR